MTADVITLPNVLAQRIRGAYERTERGRQEWIEGTLELAAALAEARGQFTSDRQFSVWLAENELDAIGHQDRAALINMASDQREARAVLEETRRNSWQLIWREEMQERFTRASKPNLANAAAAFSASTPDPASNPVSETVRNPTPTSDPASKPRTLKRDHPFHGFDRADEVAAVYTSIDARGAIGRALRSKGGSKIWPLILTSLDAGLLTATNTQFSKPTLSILIPHASRAYCRRYDLSNAADRKLVAERILPAAIAERERIAAEPDAIECIVTEHWQRQEQQVRDAAARRRVEDAVRSLPVDQREVIMFGVRLWPRVDHKLGSYEYDQLCAAIWYFRDLDSWLQGGASGRSAQSRAIIIRLSTRWPQEYVDRSCDGDARSKVKKLYSLIHTLARLMEDNPDGECIVPPTPKTEAQS